MFWSLTNQLTCPVAAVAVSQYLTPASSWNGFMAVKVTIPGSVGSVVELKLPTIVPGPLAELDVMFSVKVMPDVAAWSANEAEPTVAVTGLMNLSPKPVPGPLRMEMELVSNVKAPPNVV